MKPTIWKTPRKHAFSRVLLGGLLLCLSLSACAGQKADKKDARLRMTSEDEVILHRFLQVALSENWQALEVSERIPRIAAYFMGTPYKASTLESADGVEYLTVNLREVDCMTFVENVVALNRMLSMYHAEKFPEDSCVAQYPLILKNLRYRDGEMKEYPSRLHYTSEWLFNNQQKAYLRLVTDLFGGEELPLNLYAMSGHPENYPILKNRPDYIQEIRGYESALNKRCLNYLPKQAFPQYAEEMPSGLIVAITTSAEGLDIAHLGILCRKGAVLGMIHASLTEKKVVFTEQGLSPYLSGIKRFTGVVLAEIW